MPISIILNFPKPSNSRLLFNRSFDTLFFFIPFCIKNGFKERAKVPNIFCKKHDLHIPGYSLFFHYHRFKNFFFQKWFSVLFLRSLDLLISYTMVLNCQFPPTLSYSELKTTRKRVIFDKSIGLWFTGVLRQMQRYFSYTCDGIYVQADWRRSCYGRDPNAIEIS